ncbi:uncharacterized protein [Malus domestica]|uniref:uncharacterized protein n=1 Tax=Malus domestica TaxID=3750 RepID=UPI0039766730
MSYRHLSRDFKVEQKVFILEVEDKSYGERIRITERTRIRGFQISFDFGCAAWLVDQVKEAIVKSGQNFFRKYRGHNYQFWVERFHNKNGDFLAISKSEKEGFVRNIIVPKGFNFFGWRSLGDLLSEILNGGMRAGATQRKAKRVGKEFVSSQTGAGPQVSYRDAVLGGKTAAIVAPIPNAIEEIWIKKIWNKSDISKESYSWGSVVVCERQVVHQPWREVEASLLKLLGMEIRLSPFQCNKALFVCQNEEEATKIAKFGTLTMNKLPDVVLSGWWDSINSNHRKAVSYGGWVALEGLPSHLWTINFFQKIGEACGGLVEIDRRTANFGFLLEAKLKLKPNDTGFIPEFVDVADGDSVFRVKIRQLSPAKRPNLWAEDGGVTKSPTGSLKTDLKIQRFTGAIPPANADLQQSVPSPGTRVCFRIGEFECPVTVGSDRKQGLNRHATEEARFEESATPDFTYSISTHGTPLQAESLTESASFTEEPERADATDYFKNSKRKDCLRQMFFSERGKGLEVCGKVGGGGSSTEEAQSSTSGYYFNRSKKKVSFQSTEKAKVVSGPLVDKDFYLSDFVRLAGLDPRNNFAGSCLGPFILNFDGLRYHFQLGRELSNKIFLQPPVSAVPKTLFSVSNMPKLTTEILSYRQRAMVTHFDGDPKRSPTCFKLKFLGRFGETDNLGKRLKHFLPHEFGSYQTPFERPKMMEIQSSNLTILDSVCELEEEKESDVDENPVRPPGGSTEEEPFVQRTTWTEALGMDSSHLSDCVEEEYMSQSSDSDEEIGDSSQDEKEPSDVFDCFNGELHNLFTDTNLESKAPSEEAPNQTHHMVESEEVEQSDFKDTGKNKKMLKYSRRKRSACVSVKREAQDQTSKFLSKMKVSLFPLKRSLFHERKTGKVKVSKSEGGSKGVKKLQRGIIRINEDN